MVEHALREGSSGGHGSQVLGETEGLSDGEVSLDDDEGGAGDGLFSDNDTSSLGEGLIDTSHGIIRGLDFAQEDGLHESGLSSELSTIEDSSGSGDDLTTTSVDSVGVEGNVHNVESDTSHVLLSHDSLLGGPLESSLAGVLDFVEVLDGLGLINEKVGAGGLRTEAPDLLCVVDIPLVLVGELSVSLLLVLLGGDSVLLNGVSELITKRLSNDVESVVLVG